MKDRVATVVVHYQTPDLLEVAVRSFHLVYPHISIFIVDNGSRDHSPAVIRQLQDEFGERVTALFLKENIFHGPAMHQAIRTLEKPYIFVLDSDTETNRAGFLEKMIDLLDSSESTYGAGQVVHVNKRGFVSPEGIPVLASAFMLLKRAHYMQLPPFVHHGLPALNNFKAAADAGYVVQPFPIQEYITHFGRGTAERYGYGLGLKSRLDFLLNKIGL